MAPRKDFVPALIVVDFQEDFCPPNGALPVSGGRDIAPAVNSLLSLLGFHMRIATKDWHPPAHISFASNHAPPNNTPFTSTATISNPLDPSQTFTTRLWPVHCVQGTPGAALVPELDVGKVDRVIEKGVDERAEMYSAFQDPFATPCAKSGLAALLKGEGVTHCFVVGLAMDYCVRWTAVDAAREGFETVVVGECTRAVDPGSWATVEEELLGKGVRIVSVDGEEVGRVRERHAE